MPLNAQNDVNLEVSDKSLYKRLQYAKEILVQMMSVQSMPPTLALTSHAAANLEDPVENLQIQPVAQKLNCALTNLLTAPETRPRMATANQPRSASKGIKVMSPYNSKSTQKTKEHARTYRMQTMTASKVVTSTNLLNSNAKKYSNKVKFELPLLSSRSNSKPMRNTPQSINQKVMTQASLTQSHNFLPTKIG